ncbi:hypothetical protein EI555_016745, partial [Monodon monoceros]
NTTAGHLLIHLIRGTTLALLNISTTTALITFIILVLLTMLKFAVALTQAYVFTLLYTNDNKILSEKALSKAAIHQSFKNDFTYHSLIEGNCKHMLQALFITITLGVYFTLLQASEYYKTLFTISDRVYGSIFFIATGLHGLPIIIGSTFLVVCFLGQLKFHFTYNHHFSFEDTA